MRLRNKKTGEMGELQITEKHCAVVVGNGTVNCNVKLYCTLDKLNEDWEDYEEPKDTNYWCIDSLGKIEFHSTVLDEVDGTPNNAMVRKIIGNYFDTREEAKQAVEKLKAFRRLKDKGFRFTITPGVGSLDIAPGKFQIEINAEMPEKWFCCDAVQKDLDDCFGGEE